MRELIYPGIYKHFKNKYYATMGVSTPMTTEEILEYKNKHNNELYELLDLEASHTELNDNIAILKLDDKWVHVSNVESSQLVIYKSLYDNTGAYARPIDMFLNEVDREKYPDVEQAYRFKLVR